MTVLKSVLYWAELGQKFSGKLSGIRFIHESDEETIDRVCLQARKTMCGDCGGRGSGIVGTCRLCCGSGERAYDPNEKPVREVMES